MYFVCVSVRLNEKLGFLLIIMAITTLNQGLQLK
jgi:hypothetical protein